MQFPRRPIRQQHLDYVIARLAGRAAIAVEHRQFIGRQFKSDFWHIPPHQKTNRPAITLRPAKVLRGGNLCAWSARPQVAPIDIWAKFLACDLALCGTLDGWAIVGRDVASAAPVIDHLRRDLYGLGERRLRPEDRFCCFKCLHAAHNKQVGTPCQQVGRLFSTIVLSWAHHGYR